MKQKLSALLIVLLLGTLVPAGSFAAGRPGAPEFTQVSSMDRMKEGELLLQWTDQACSGYQVQVAKDAAFTDRVSYDLAGRQTQLTLTDMEKGALVFARVRGFSRGSGVKTYGDWSRTGKVKIHAHALRMWTKKEASCTEDGTRITACYACGYTVTARIPKTGHAGVKKGSQTVCKRCGKILSGGTVKPTKPTKPVTPTKPKPTKAKKLTKAQRNSKARHAAVDWAKKIAADNSFHYGKPSWAHHNGCYFCGTNQKKGSLKRKAGASRSACLRTYCCNPFVTAAYKHGAGAKEVDCKKKNKRFGLAYDSNKVLKNRKAFRRISKPKRITSLAAGDILLTPTHCMLYAGGGKVVEAAHHDNGKRGSYWNDSIRCKKISARQWKRTKKIYRYTGVGKY